MKDVEIAKGVSAGELKSCESVFARKDIQTRHPTMRMLANVCDKLLDGFM